MAKTKPLKVYAKVAKKDWTDWKWQIRNRIANVAQLRETFPEIGDEEAANVERVLARFRMAITPYYASLIDIDNPLCPVRQQAIPSAAELHDAASDMADPLEEDRDRIAPGLTHRYPDRVLMLLTDVCNMYCRHCTRRRLVGERDAAYNDKVITAQIEAIKKQPQVRDIVISGGDPLTMGDRKLESILKRLRAIDHIQILRIGTRSPVVNPFRITPALAKMLAKYNPLYVNTHFNHYKELTPEAVAACERLANAGLPLGNQSVLLRNVNDCPHIMKKLVHGLLQARVRPYYIYQCDLSQGISHFRTSVGKGIEIIEGLRGHTSGLAVPTFVVDCPAGGGKVPLMPNYVISRSDDKVVLRNYKGTITVYKEPHNFESICGRDPACDDPRYQNNEGPARLMRNLHLAIEPNFRKLKKH